MDSSKEKIVHISKDSQESDRHEPEKAEKHRDMGKAAVFISVLTVLLLVVFFYALNRNVTGLAIQVEEIGTLQQRVDQMDASIVDIRNEMAALQNLPAEARRTIMRSMLQDISQRTDFIASEAETEGQSEKLQQARALLQEVQEELAQ